MADNNANEYSTVTLSLDDGTECESERGMGSGSKYSGWYGI